MTIISECAELTVTIWEEIIGQCDQKLRKRSGLKVGFVYHNLAVNVLTFKIQFYKFLSYVNRYHHPHRLLFFPFFFLSFCYGLLLFILQTLQNSKILLFLHYCSEKINLLFYACSLTFQPFRKHRTQTLHTLFSENMFQYVCFLIFWLVFFSSAFRSTQFCICATFLHFK